MRTGVLGLALFIGLLCAGCTETGEACDTSSRRCDCSGDASGLRECRVVAGTTLLGECVCEANVVPVAPDASISDSDGIEDLSEPPPDGGSEEEPDLPDNGDERSIDSNDDSDTGLTPDGAGNDSSDDTRDDVPSDAGNDALDGAGNDASDGEGSDPGEQDAPDLADAVDAPSDDADRGPEFDSVEIDAATDGDACDNGGCAFSDVCTGGSCLTDTGTHSCEASAVPCDAEADTCEASCGNDDVCDGVWGCVEGSCAFDPTTVLSCPSMADECSATDCDPVDGCVVDELPDATPCDDRDSTTIDDTCFAGRCRSGVSTVPSFLPGTGQDRCFETDGTERDCGSQESSSYGQDGDLIRNLFNYDTATVGVIEDELTGFSWEQTPPPSSGAAAQAASRCESLTLGGRDDWRLPSVRELLTVVDYGVDSNAGEPTLDLAFDGPRGLYWTGDLDPSNDLRGMRVSFRYGTTGTQIRTVTDGYSRCVAGDPPLASPSAFPIEADNGVYVPASGLFWQRIPSGELMWEGAIAYCQGLRSQGLSGFRLPDVRELGSLLDAAQAYPALDPSLFPGIRVGQTFWTSTTSNDPEYRDHTYTVGLGDFGSINIQDKSDFRQALCVRACPCPDPACCAACLPLGDGVPCDDGDPATIYDGCDAGQCVGLPTGSTLPDPGPPFDCDTLECGELGICIRDELDEESCLCDLGAEFDGSPCVRSEHVSSSSVGCIPVTVGYETVCLNPPEPREPGPEAAARARGARSAEVRPASHVIEPWPGFQTHNQRNTNTCVPNATSAGLELQLGSDPEPVSEASLVLAYADVPLGRRDDGIICNGVNTPKFISRIAGDSEPITSESSGEIHYCTSFEGGACVGGYSCESGADNDGLVTWPDRDEEAAIRLVAAENLMRGLFSPKADTTEIRQWLAQDVPVVVSLPVWADDAGHSWQFSGSSAGTGWPVISSRTALLAGRADVAAACRQPDSDGIACPAPDGDGTCRSGLCRRGSHAVLLVGYDDARSGGMFYFLNSWGSWGQTAFGYETGLGVVSYEFVEKYASSATALSEVELPCTSRCELDDVRCTGPDTGLVCGIVDSAGCVDYSVGLLCADGYECVDGEGCNPVIGDGRCTANETCGSSPSDCACGLDETCTGSAGDGCVSACDHACAPGETGCVEGSRARWFCGLAPDGDACRDQVEETCGEDEVCRSGVCELECQPSDHRDCHPTDNAVWMFDSCDRIEGFVEACGPTGTCDAGECQPCEEPDVTVCNDGDEWWASGCTGVPLRLRTDCGESGFGSPRCSADGDAAIVDQFERTCRDGACALEWSEQVTNCNGGICTGGTCGVRCGDGICAPGVEDCGSCPGDCPCWGSGTTECYRGECVQCVVNTDCYPGCNCIDNSCVFGCHRCEPVGAERCDADGGREVCRRVNNCNAWVDEPCGATSACCQGTCASTALLGAPTPVAPADGATMPADGVHFRWTNPAGASRVRIVLCRDDGLTDCVAAYEPRPGYYYATVSVPPGDWWWSVSATTACDLAPWGAPAAARQVRVR